MQDDDLPVQEVGPWAKEKHERLRKYVDISRAARRKFIEGTGGAAYIDLYCGSGRSHIRDTAETIEGSPLVAFQCASDGGVPFSAIHIADAVEGVCRAAQKRLEALGASPIIHVGQAEQTAQRIVGQLNPHGLHFAFLDPYNLEQLPFSVFEALARLKRIDILIHVSAQDLQRNLDAYSSSKVSPLDRFAPGWREAVDLGQSQSATRAAYMAYWSSKLETLGLPPARRAELVSATTKNQRLYWLVFVSRSEFAKGLWDKIRNVSGQGELSF
jgi:three-Cys-motif partner protein